MDEIEREYLREIDRATREQDNDAAFELSTGLTEYRRHFRIPPLPPEGALFIDTESRYNPDWADGLS